MADLALLIQLDSDPAVKRFIDNGAPVDIDDLVDTLTSWLSYYDRFDGYGFWAAIEQTTQQFVGWFHFRPGEHAGIGETELGYRLRQESWGLGYATEASQALIDKGFTEFAVQRVNAETMAVNLASRRVMEKVGMKLVRSFVADWPVRIPGDEHGDVEYAIDREQWQEAR